MTRLPRLKGKEVIRTLEKIGFEVSRVKDSHHFLKHSDGRCTVVPIHAGEIIGPGLFSKILRDCDLSRSDFLKLLK